MSERTKKFSDQLSKLIKQGEALHMAMNYNCHRETFVEAVRKKFDDDNDQIEKYLSGLPDFRDTYQKWYSEAQAVIKQVLPDRLADFRNYYEYPRVRKETTFQNYMIKDYLQGLQITRGGGYEVIADGSAAIPEFIQQLNMVKAARDTLDSTLLDLSEVLQADLFDTEIDSAEALAKAGHLRAAGAICGVVLEKHLSHVCSKHNLTIKKKNPGISDLLQILRAGNVITLAQERFIQSLADTRNVCSHAKGREPKKEEIEELIEGTGKVLKTIF
ncbi:MULTISPECIES: hypothetical protein [unclassified Leisingera]|uniref:hypothetical protein n=1 Tax=unclassified Leisingera TaxID=2614906 RepID=UPI0004925029|nr:MULTISPECIES: hypothetical protein [unclassified Leisingera]KIC20474.1 hypothetical protein RA23_21730 [Leisingera sp. ANG-S3]KIC48325.1 hypothetical protein RA22_21475 [Leisingera sp. ANG-S]KID07758.1 hypothetical protein GC1_17220 [Leisingera sp. ANG1]